MGKFHPLTVHLPIGILIYVFLQYIYNNYYKKEKKSNDLLFGLSIILFTSFISVFTGYQRSISGGFEGDLLNLHKSLAFVFLGSTILLLACYKKYNGTNKYLLLMILSVGLMCYTGHLGGSLTHGTDFFRLDDGNVKSLQNPLEAHVYNDIVMPIVKSKCLSCHNENKKKGDLLMTTKEAWIKGGKNGTLIDFLDKEKSTFLKRIHLPHEDKEHMPPSGKKQLTPEEFKFLDWWVKSADSYDQRLIQLKPEEKIMDIILSLYGNRGGIKSYSVQDLKNLFNNGIKYHQLDQKKLFLSIDFTNSNFDSHHIKLLDKLADNVEHLDLSFAKFDSKVLKDVKSLKNLKRIDLDNTAIKTDDIKHLNSLSKLEVLNLYNTNVDDNALAEILKLPNLKQVYLWQSKVTLPAVQELLGKRPNLSIDIGVDDKFDDAKLASPILETDEFIFRDSIDVALKALPAKATIIYSFSQDSLTENTQVYQKPITLFKSTNIQAKAKLKGWNDSDFVQFTFLKSSIIPNKIDLTNLPDDKYKAEGRESLFDMKKGSETFSDGRWLGFSEKDCIVDIELASEKFVSSIAIGSLSDFGSYIFLPRGIEIKSSIDGVVYHLLKSDYYPEMEGPEPKQLKNILLTFDKTKVKFLRIRVINQKNNPIWHPAPKAPSWLFIDEITID